MQPHCQPVVVVGALGKYSPPLVAEADPPAGNTSVSAGVGTCSQPLSTLNESVSTWTFVPEDSEVAFTPAEPWTFDTHDRMTEAFGSEGLSLAGVTPVKPVGHELACVIIETFCCADVALAD